MKLLFDQNISHRILKKLTPKFKESSTVKGENLINANDREIWKVAKNNGFTIVTQDSDFNELNNLLGFPPKIIWFRTGNLPTSRISEILIENYEQLNDFVKSSNYGCFEIFPHE